MRRCGRLRAWARLCRPTCSELMNETLPAG
jgi:hypothetical protein